MSGAARDTRLHEREIQLKALAEQRTDLEVRARYLRTGSLSRDLLEERARAVLGFADPRDYVIHVASPSGSGAAPARAITAS